MTTAETRALPLHLRGFLVRQGYANRHHAYPFGVIAHTVDRVRERRRSPQRFGRGAQALKGLAADVSHGHREGWSPLRPPHRLSDHRPPPGLWAVEPHLGFRGPGVTFEEILVVNDSRDTEERAFRLDDHLPHVRHWTEAKAAAEAETKGTGGAETQGTGEAETKGTAAAQAAAETKTQAAAGAGAKADGKAEAK